MTSILFQHIITRYLVDVVLSKIFTIVDMSYLFVRIHYKLNYASAKAFSEISKILFYWTLNYIGNTCRDICSKNLKSIFLIHM